jgi:hypothetical protein
VGSKRDTMSGGSTPPSMRFHYTWVPWYVEWFSRFFFLSICTFIDWILSLFSVSTSSGTPPLDRSRARSALGAHGAQDVSECRDPQGPSIEALRGDGTPYMETVPDMDTTTMMGAAASVTTSEVAAGGMMTPSSPAFGVPQILAVTTSAAIGDDALEGPKVVMGHPDLGALG